MLSDEVLSLSLFNANAYGLLFLDEVPEKPSISRRPCDNQLRSLETETLINWQISGQVESNDKSSIIEADKCFEVTEITEDEFNPSPRKNRSDDEKESEAKVEIGNGKRRSTISVATIPKELNCSFVPQEESKQDGNSQIFECCICYCKKTLMMAKCRHLCCHSCWKSWVAKSKVCPICRGEVTMKSLTAFPKVGKKKRAGKKNRARSTS